MKHIIILFFFFFQTLVLFAKGNIAFVHKNIPVQSIEKDSIGWTEISEPIYRGLDNGVYWFKINLTPTRKDIVISIPESHISRAKLFLEGREINKSEPNRYVTFIVPNSEKRQICYLRVNCLLEARIPIEIEEFDIYTKNEQKQYFIIGIYIGIVLAIIVFSLLSYYSFGNKTYLLYVFMVIGLSGNAFYKDGLTAYLFGLNGINEVIEPFINTIVPIVAFYFTATYLQLENQLKKLRLFGVSIIILTVATQVFYLISGSFYLFAGIALLNLLSITVFYIQGPILWNKNDYTKLYTIAYGALLLFAYDYYISPHFGIRFLNLPLDFYKTGSILEMAIFSYAIMSQAKAINKNNKVMRQELVDYTQKLKSLNKGLSERPDTITELVEKFGLTLKEIEILKILSLNKTNKEIAEQQFISENTVKYHIKNLCKKLGVHSKKEAQFHYLNFKS